MRRNNISQPCPAAFLKSFWKAEAEVWPPHFHSVPSSNLAPGLSPAFPPTADPGLTSAVTLLHPSLLLLHPLIYPTVLCIILLVQSIWLVQINGTFNENLY